MTTDLSKIALDSKQGITILVNWARAHRIMLNDSHRRIAKRYGVSVEGVLFSSSVVAA